LDLNQNQGFLRHLGGAGGVWESGHTSVSGRKEIQEDFHLQPTNNPEGEFHKLCVSTAQKDIRVLEVIRVLEDISLKVVCGRRGQLKATVTSQTGRVTKASTNQGRATGRSFKWRYRKRGIQV